MKDQILHEFDLDPAVKNEAGDIVKPARVVVMRELSSQEIDNLTKQASRESLTDLANRGLRQSLVRDGEDDLEYKKLAGGHLFERYTSRELFLLRQVFDQIHFPSVEDQARVKATRVSAG